MAITAQATFSPTTATRSVSSGSHEDGVRFMDGLILSECVDIEAASMGLRWGQCNAIQRRQLRRRAGRRAARIINAPTVPFEWGYGPVVYDVKANRSDMTC